MHLLASLLVFLILILREKEGVSSRGRSVFPAGKGGCVILRHEGFLRRFELEKEHVSSSERRVCHPECNERSLPNGRFSSLPTRPLCHCNGISPFCNRPFHFPFDLWEMMQRVSLHVLFWVTYLALKTYMGVFLINYSWFDLEMGLRIQKSLLPELVVLIPKMLLAYTVMYGILPRFRFQSRWWVARSVAGITLLSLVLYHILWKYILFGVLFREEAPESSFSGDLSRYIWRMLDMFAVVGVACTIHLMRRQVEASRRQEQLVREKLQSELNFLRSQTNPHFLFNTLNSIYALSRKQSPQTPDVVMQLSKLLRYMIYECSAPQVPLEQEWKIIEDYVNLEKLRFGSRIEVEMKMENLDGGETIAPLLLLPLVENAFKHGAGNNRYQTRISLDLNKKGETITFTVINTCAPAAENEVIPTGIGLQNTRRQLELLYPGFTFETKRENGIFRASLALQLPRHETALPDH